MSRQSDELRDYFDKNGILNKDVCEATGVAPATLSNILAGRFGISKKMAARLAQVYGFDITFLVSGEGALFPDPRVRKPAEAHNDLRAEVQDLREQLERERAEKARLLGIIETITKC